MTVFAAAVVCAYFFVEMLVYLTAKKAGSSYSFSFDAMINTGLGRLMTAVRAAFFFMLFLPMIFIIRRCYADISQGCDLAPTKRYIRANLGRLYPRALATSCTLFMLKFFMAVPIGLGAYQIYYWGWVCKLDTLTSAGLFCFMLSLGFTVVWIGVFMHYCISLSLANYIMILNPRANVFDACDLSQKLMDGRHTDYMSFWLSFAKYLPVMIFIYSIFGIVPYFRTAHIVFAENVMGRYWQDKFPAMIRRWEKHAH